LVAVLSTSAAAPPPGAVECSGCHGKGPQPPALTGRVPEEIVVALDAFRAGTKQATVMNRIAKGFTHDESVAIAVWLTAPK
jgi:cytochrome c553